MDEDNLLKTENKDKTNDKKYNEVLRKLIGELRFLCALASHDASHPIAIAKIMFEEMLENIQVSLASISINEAPTSGFGVSIPFYNTSWTAINAMLFEHGFEEQDLHVPGVALYQGDKCVLRVLDNSPNTKIQIALLKIPITKIDILEHYRFYMMMWFQLIVWKRYPGKHIDILAVSLPTSISSLSEEQVFEKTPSEDMLRRFGLIQAIKQKHPEWGMKKTAEEYEKQTKEYISEHTIRNIYRALGKKWDRGERTR